MRMFRPIAPLLLLVGIATAQIQRNPDITAAELEAHVKFLASDALQGRRAGSPGADEAAQYIAREFQRDQLTPLGPDGSYLQTFDFISGVRLGAKNAFTAETPTGSQMFRLDSDFRPLGFSANGACDGPLVFAGYGISLPEKQYDDFAGLDVRDKIVLVFRGSPTLDSASQSLEMISSVRYKATKAKDLGAKAILFVLGPAEKENDRLIRLSYDQSTGSGDIPALSLTQQAADRLVQTTGHTLRQLQESIDGSRTPASCLVPNTRLHIATDVETIPARSSNVIGYLPGNDPLLKDQVVVIGAHYDHLGMGGEGSGSLKPDTVAVHPGADDNGSGTAGLLELAEAFAAHRNELRRSLLFVAFTGEELGLLGSAYYVKHPVIPLERTVSMLNMDMIGRLSHRTLIVYGTGTAPEFDSLVRAHDADSAFVLKLVRDGYGPSDQASFYGKQIPVLHFFTDLHGDYHRPTDTEDRLNYPALQSVVRFVDSIATDIDRSPVRPAYVAVAMPKPSGAMRGYRVFVGTIPDFGEQTDGMKISGVREGSPAARAGLRGGDIIVKFGGAEIKNLYDYTYALGAHKPGETVEVIVKRGTELVKTEVTLEARN